MKKLTILLLSIICASFFTISIKAVSSDYIIEKQSESKVLDGGVVFNNKVLSTKFVSKDQTDVYWKDRNVYSLEVAGDNEEVKIVTWSHSNKNGYLSSKLVDIAKDYELNHPGWSVIGGVNGEGFHNSSSSIPSNTGEIINAFAQDGKVIKKDVSSENFKELIGFFDDNTHIVKQVPTYTDYLQLKVENTNFDIKYVNNLPLDNEIAILTKTMTNEIDVSEYNVIKADLITYRQTQYYIDVDPNFYLTGNNYGLFLEGDILGLQDIKTIASVKSNEFYIVTKNQSVCEKLIAGANVICQYDFTNDFENVTSMVGYMFKLVENNETITPDYKITDTISYANHAYYWSNKQRCGIGFKDDGGIVLLTANSGTGGPSQYEVGEMFRTMGCSSAYQFDGGGSVSFVIKNEDGEFEMLNEPADGVERRIGDGIFFVVRDPGFEAKSNNRGEITVDFSKSLYKNDIKEIKVVVNDKEYEMTNDSITIANLLDDSKYSVKCIYKIKSLKDDNKFIQKEKILTVQTKGFEVPKCNLEILDIKHNGFTIRKTENTPDNVFDIFVVIKFKTYKMENDELVIDFLESDTSYFLDYNYSVTDSVTGNVYQGKESMIYVKTASCSIPEIISFSLNEKKENSLKFVYDIKDESNIIYDAYIVLNGREYPVDYTKNEITIENIDLTKEDLNAVLYVSYYEKEDITISSEEITIEKEEVIENETEEDKTEKEKEEDKNGCNNFTNIIKLLNFGLIALFLIRKSRK